MSKDRIVTEDKTSLYEKINSSPDDHDEELAQSAVQEDVKARWIKIFSAYILIVVSMVLNCVSITTVQVLDGVIPEFELNAWRFGSNFAIIVLLITIKKIDLRVPRKIWPHIIALFFIANCYNLFYYGSAALLPVGTVFAMVQSIAIVGNAVLSICIPRERKLPLYVGAVVVVVGIFLVTQPDFLFPDGFLPPDPVVNWTSPCFAEIVTVNRSSQNATLSLERSAEGAVFGYVIVVLAGISVVAYFQLVYIVVDVIPPFAFTFWNSLVCTMVSLILMLIFERPVMVTSFFCVSLLLGHAFGTAQSTIIYPWCLQYLIPSIGNMVHSFQLVVLLILQYTVLKDIQPGHGNWLEILGAALVFAGVVGAPVWHLVRQRNEDLKKAKDEERDELIKK